MIRLPPRSTRTDTLFPYTTLFRSIFGRGHGLAGVGLDGGARQKIGGDIEDVIAFVAIGWKIGRVRLYAPCPCLDAGGQVVDLIAGGVVIEFARYGVALGREQADVRSEESRVGKEYVSTCRSRWSPSPLKKKKK